MSIEKNILKIIAEKHVISVEEISKQIGEDINTIKIIVNRLKEKGYIHTSDLLPPNMLVVTVSGSNAIV
ncbi:MAG: hypothetical protein B6U88_03370 [Candidatus Aenigmarchaeota archaeon ex4484_56]|nr:MAG: hypothetical protein B6U88_03370 [Candidatus Aenigmarchaeota archaeon ex4484_56]